MENWEKETAIILRRMPYKDNQYLVDIFLKQKGLHRAVARIHKTKQYRDTQSLSPYQEIEITGRKKTELAVIWKSEAVNNYQPNFSSILNACYLNELMLTYAHGYENSEHLYQSYLYCLKKPNSQALRYLEWLFIDFYGMLPPVESTNDYYQLSVGASTAFTISDSGYPHTFIHGLQTGNPDLNHHYAKPLFQAILNHHKQLKNRTRSIAKAINKLN